MLVCALSLALAAFAAPAQAAEKPDLTIAGYAVHGLRYAFEGEQGRIMPHDVTRNAGTARAGRSITRAYLIHGPAGDVSEIELAKRPIPRLAAKAQNAGDAWAPTHIYNYPIGAYLIELCADDNHQVPESDETNNCTIIRNPVLETIKVFIVRRIWTGTASGVATLGNVTEQYKAQHATLRFDKPIRVEDGVFGYDFDGRVVYSDSGSGGGCTWSGGGSRAFGPEDAQARDDITFDYLGKHYGGSASVDSGFSYTIQQKCGSATYPMSGPLTPNFFNAGQRTLPFGATHISGSTQSSAQNWVWSFD